ncbi:HDOD domain-containing protein [Cellvibrio sp. KY-GH-1]|uniref:HDOD domain-containing protein n=1 Tax=Cellvibrio sp. KY-GH-1 TaxID=2303332 RepID=UPI001CD9A17A|nr:HDOD domain-containing protein [Cellvibrio sp. KY-GH-1]
MGFTHANYAVYREVIAQLMQGNEQLPSLPSITLEIRRTLARPDVSFITLSKILAKDPSLSAMLLKYASSPHFSHPPLHSLLDVVRVLGLDQVERITMVHSVTSLFTMHSAYHKRLFVDAWHRVVLKASVSSFLARHIPLVPEDQVLLVSLLSEIGTLGVLSAFKDREHPPPEDMYVSLCREYSKSLGVIMMKKWQVNEAFIQVIRRIGNWHETLDAELDLADLVNLGLYHALVLRKAGRDLPPLTDLAAYQKLDAPFNLLDQQGYLSLVTQHIADIRALAIALFKVEV